jgi:predicted ribosomally synthesized peptide with SipW-like signal peptide
MSEHEFDLSRRKVLAGLGGIGVASAGAGIGTSALFTDTESFENNTIAAGELNLKVDWEEHYSYPQAYRFGDPTSGLEHDVYRSEPEDDDYVGLPDPENPTVWVHDDDLLDYMDATAIEAYPDVDDGDGGDSIQDPFADEPGGTKNGVGYVCEDGADTDEDLNPKEGLRTDNADTWDGEERKPLVSLDDVKPGDFGELTLSYHLCDNPGYVWLTGALRENAENGVTGPEAESDEENGTVEEPGTDGELLDAIRTRVWYDDGDNVVEVDDGDDAGYLTPELSLGELLLFLERGDGVLLCPDGGDGTVVQPPPSDDCVDEKDPDSVHVSGDEVTIEGPSSGEETTLTIAGNPKCADFGLIQGLKTDEAPEGQLPPETSDPKEYETPYGTISVSTDLIDVDGDQVQTVTGWSIDSDDGYCVAKVIVKGGNEGANVYSYDNENNGGDPDGDPDEPYNDFTDDDVVGAASDDTALQTPTGQDISHVDFCLAASTGGGNGDPGDGDCCIEPSTTHHVGFAWWLPEDVGNEVQSDSVRFDLGFYTEQCRNNDLSEDLPAET